MKAREVFLVELKRTPHARAGMDMSTVDPPFLGTGPIRSILDKTGIPGNVIDEVIIGNVGSPVEYSNVARVIALESGLDEFTPAFTVNRNCAAGMEAVTLGALRIATGRGDLIFAGGVESMSQMPLLYDKRLGEIIFKFGRSKKFKDKFEALMDLRPSYFKPMIALEKGLTDPFCGLNMGKVAEKMAVEFKISREEQDHFACRSHQKAVKAQEEGKFNDEIVPIIVGKKLDRILDRDIGPRKDSSFEKLSLMKPYFDRRWGTVTIGNSCPVTDGGSIVLLASEDALDKFKLGPVAKIIDWQAAAVAPDMMGMGPVPAMGKLLARNNLKVEEIDLFEINEPFASVVLSIKKGMGDLNIARRFGLENGPGEIPDEKLNVNGGSIALGHPVGSSGCRIMVTLGHELKRRKGRLGMASICVGGGQGVACLIENLVK